MSDYDKGLELIKEAKMLVHKALKKIEDFEGLEDEFNEDFVGVIDDMKLKLTTDYVILKTILK